MDAPKKEAPKEKYSCQFEVSHIKKLTYFTYFQGSD
jgi:hypothetical protein